jgi:hypothetical protein
MLDHGLIGVMIVPLLVLAVTWGARGEGRRVAIIFGCGILMLNLFTHSFLNTGHGLILLPLMAAMAAASGHREIKRTMAMEMRDGGAEVLVGPAPLTPARMHQ